MEDWSYYFYYWYVPGRGIALLFGTDNEVAEAAENNPNEIIFASQEELWGYTPGFIMDVDRINGDR